MFGALRLALAALVVYSHLVISPPAFEIGVPAVVIFFLISGFAMTGLIHVRFRTQGAASTFYLERFVRLSPQYYFWLVIAMFLSFNRHWTGVNSEGFLPYGLFSYIFVIPLGLQSYFGQVNTYLMAQASSLGVEICCYIFAPWILKSRRMSWLASCVCLSIFIATALTKLPEAQYTYYNFPGPMLLFLIGSFIYRKDWLSVSLIVTATCAILLYALPQHWNIEFLAGLTVGVPAITLLSKLSPRKWDTELGNASYGCFLGHGSTNASFYWYFGQYVAPFPFFMHMSAIVIACIAGYAAYYVVERPTLSFRRSLKGRTLRRSDAMAEQISSR